MGKRYFIYICQSKTMTTYTITQVSPSKEPLVFQFDVGSSMTAAEVGRRAMSVLISKLVDQWQGVITEFSHTFATDDPWHATIVLALGVGFGDMIVEYRAYIVTKTEKPKS